MRWMPLRIDDGVEMLELTEVRSASGDTHLLSRDDAESALRRVTSDDTVRSIRLGLYESGWATGRALEDERALEGIIDLIRRGEVGLRRVPRPFPTVSHEMPAVDLADLAEPVDQVPPPQTQTWFEAQLVDQIGAPLKGVEVKLIHDGNEETLTTDGDGRVRLDGVTSRSAQLWVPATDSLRDALEPAWSKPSTDPPVEPSEDLEIAYFRDDLIGPLRLRPETPKALSIQPFVVLGRMTGMLFDTNKSFLLPVSLESIAEMVALFDRCAPCHLLVVGHTDTSGQPDYNEKLSLERAQSVLEYMTDDVDAWLERYDDSVPAEKRWGTTEDLHMIRSLADFASREPGRDPVRWFQATRGLKEDGIAGPNTRGALVTEYMGRDGTTLPDDVVAQTHGCGEAFPLDATGEEVDTAPVDGADDPLDRRVELFFFGDQLGVQPPPPGETSKAGSTEYLSWRKRANETHERVMGARALEIELRDAEGKPVPNAAYRIELPSGAVVEGQLDAGGFARVERLPEGFARVDFPELSRGFVAETITPL